MPAPALIIPNGLHDLLADPRRAEAVAHYLVRVVESSFAEDAQRVGHPVDAKQTEVTRRTQICIENFRDFREGMGWSAQRALETLPAALRARLDGVRFIPSDSASTTWAVPNSARLETGTGEQILARKPEDGA